MSAMGETSGGAELDEEPRQLSRAATQETVQDECSVGESLEPTQPPEEESSVGVTATTARCVWLISSTPCGANLRLGIGEHSLGRGRDNDFQFELLSISSKHASLAVSEDSIVVTDLSTFGVQINGTRITAVDGHKRCAVVTGDSITFSNDIKFTVEAASQDGNRVDDESVSTETTLVAQQRPDARVAERLPTVHERKRAAGRAGRRRENSKARKAAEVASQEQGPSALGRALNEEALKAKAVESVQHHEARRALTKAFVAVDKAAALVAGAARDGTTASVQRAMVAAASAFKKAAADSSQATKTSGRKRKRESNRALDSLEQATTIGPAGSGRRQGSERHAAKKQKHQKQQQRTSANLGSGRGKGGKGRGRGGKGSSAHGGGGKGKGSSAHGGGRGKGSSAYGGGGKGKGSSAHGGGGGGGGRGKGNSAYGGGGGGR